MVKGYAEIKIEKRGFERLFVLSSGCTDGGSICSTSDFNTTTVCPQGGGGGEGRGCQQVEMPVCYGSSGACNLPYQQCCLNNQQRVCQQVPQRIPIQR